MKRHQRGSVVVELAIVGTGAFMLLLGCLEIGHMLFVWNTVAEATRRGARVAAVHTVGDPAVTTAVMTYSPFLTDLKSTNVTVSDLDSPGATPLVTANVKYVRVAVEGYEISLSLPIIDTAVPVPTFTTTIPAESLGFDPDA